MPQHLKILFTQNSGHAQQPRQKRPNNTLPLRVTEQTYPQNMTAVLHLKSGCMTTGSLEGLLIGHSRLRLLTKIVVGFSYMNVRF